MSTVLWMLGFCAALALIFAIASDRASYFFTSLRSGAMIWAQVFPMVALLIYYYCLTANLVSIPLPHKATLSLASLFSQAELSFFFVAGVALLTRVSSFIALVLTGYTVQRLYFSGAATDQFSIGVAVFAGSLTIITLLCDCLPWVQDSSQKMLGDKMREIFVLIFSFVSMASLFACILKFPEFHSWVSDQHTALDAKSKYILLSILVLFLGWLTVSIGIARQVIIPILVLPTIVIVNFLTGWSPTILFVFFTAIIVSSFVNRKILVYSTTRITYL